MQFRCQDNQTRCQGLNHPQPESGESRIFGGTNHTPYPATPEEYSKEQLLRARILPVGGKKGGGGIHHEERVPAVRQDGKNPQRKNREGKATP